MKPPYNTTWLCPKCERETEVEFYPEVPAKTFGPPEDCYPGDPAEIEPDECYCGHEIDIDDITELLDGSNPY